jgi:hypothetical protein
MARFGIVLLTIAAVAQQAASTPLNSDGSDHSELVKREGDFLSMLNPANWFGSSSSTIMPPSAGMVASVSGTPMGAYGATGTLAPAGAPMGTTGPMGPMGMDAGAPGAPPATPTGPNMFKRGEEDIPKPAVTPTFQRRTVGEFRRDDTAPRVDSPAPPAAAPVIGIRSAPEPTAAGV